MTPHACNGNLRRSGSPAVSRAHARKEAASPRDKGRGSPAPARSARAGRRVGASTPPMRGWGTSASPWGVPASLSEEELPQREPGLPQRPRPGPVDPDPRAAGESCTHAGGRSTHIAGATHPSMGATLPSQAIRPEERFLHQGTGAHPATHAAPPPPPPPPPRSWPASGASNPGHARTGAPHGGDERPAGANAHVTDGRRTGARPQHGSRSGGAARFPRTPTVPPLQPEP